MPAQGIDLPGVRNARELGGYRIGEMTIKKGILLRSGSLTGATEEARRDLAEKYRVQTIADFRMSEETAKSPDPEIPGARKLHLPMLETADMNTPDPEYVAVIADPAVDKRTKFEMTYRKKIIDEQVYVDFLRKERGKSAIRGFFGALAELEDGRAILWHCRDGKDRTGLAAMLLLSALGADRETVLADYMLTNEFNRNIVEEAEKAAAEWQMPRDMADLYLFMTGGVIRGYMECALEYLDREYGGATGYLEKEIGIGADERERLRAKFLTREG